MSGARARTSFHALVWKPFAKSFQGSFTLAAVAIASLMFSALLL